MARLSRFFRRAAGAAGSRSSSRGAGDGAEALRSLFAKFRRILDMNTRCLERMAAMEQALGGDYIFDQAFLDSSVRELSSHVHQVVYSLNAMSGERFVELYDRYQEIKGVLEDILGGGPGPHASATVLAADAIRWDMEPLVGPQAARMAELRSRLDLPVADGFAVTTTGCARLLAGGADRDAAAETVLERAGALAGSDDALAVAVCLAGPPDASPSCPPETAETGLDGLVTVLTDMLRRLPATEADDADLRPAAWVRRAAPVLLHGRILSLSPEIPGGILRVDAALDDDPSAVERFLVGRTHPFGALVSEIRPKPVRGRLPDGSTPLSDAGSGLRRGSALLAPDALRRLAEAGMAAERLFGQPQEVEFALDRRGEPVILAARPLDVPVAGDPHGDREPALADALASAEVLLRGGQTAQSGAAAGMAMHVSDLNDVSDFPAGAVAVARRASPRLAPVLRRASALVTEVGTPAGHLATIAREARIPTLLGAAGALERIPDGELVTVDASGGAVYRGAIPALLGPAASGSELYPTDPEYVLLRRLLRFIQPLRLIDPQAPDFDPAHCRSYHDIIHFAHEQAVEELLHIQQRHDDIGAVRTRRLDLGVPLDLRMLDMDTDPDEAPQPDEASPLEVRSHPLRAFLRGLMRTDMWDDRPAGLRLRDVFSGMDRTFAAMTAPPGAGGGNLAIAARDYCNVSLRLGYHFSVLDAYLGANPNQNSVYFRFVGGLADETRRGRRAALIRRVLEAMDFAVQTKGDLVTARLRMAEEPDMVAALERLGCLTAFTRQLDVAMDAEADVAALARDFLTRALAPAGEE